MPPRLAAIFAVRFPVEYATPAGVITASAGSQPGTQPLLGWLLVPLRLFLLLLRFRCSRRGLRAQLFRRRMPRFRRRSRRRRSALGLRTLARRRSLRPLSRLISGGRRLIDLRSIVRLRYWRTIRFRPSVWLRCRWTVHIRSIVRLRCRRTIRFRPIVWLRCRRTIRFRLSVCLRGPVSIVHWMRGRRIGRWLSGGTIAWRVIRRPCRFGRYNGAIAKCTRFRSSRDCRLAMVHGSPLLWVRAGSLHMLSLNRYRWNMLLTRRRHFLRPWTRGDPTSSAVVADPVHRGAVDHRGVVNVVNYSDVHVVHRTVVEKVSVIPTSTFIAFAVVTVPVTNPAIETDMLTPVAVIEDISVAAPTPVGWSPQETDLRSHHPRTRHPVVIAVVFGVTPVPRCPEITVAGTKRLLVDGQFRWREADRYADLRERCRRHGQQHECEQQRTNSGDDTHCGSFLLDQFLADQSFAYPESLCGCGLRGLKGTISGRNVLADSVSPANGSDRNLLISEMSRSEQKSSLSCSVRF
jgi:hypothetical protein